jgi:hypothetical protein
MTLWLTISLSDTQVVIIAFAAFDRYLSAMLRVTFFLHIESWVFDPTPTCLNPWQGGHAKCGCGPSQEKLHPE